MLTDRDLSESTLERLGSSLTMRNRSPGWIHSPEVDLINFECDVPGAELVKLARARCAARTERKRIRRARYLRRHGQSQQSWPPKYLYCGAGGITGTRPECIIIDDPHAEMPGDDIRGKILGWYDEHLGHTPH